MKTNENIETKKDVGELITDLGAALDKMQKSVAAAIKSAIESYNDYVNGLIADFEAIRAEQEKEE